MGCELAKGWGVTGKITVEMIHVDDYFKKSLYQAELEGEIWEA